MKQAMRGFTLLEVLLAMAITALVATLAYAGLSTASTAAERHRTQVARLDEVATALGWLSDDLLQTVPRAITDGYGQIQPALSGDALRTEVLELTRAGWHNRRGSRRGTLQRVRYRLDLDGVLWRDYWLVLDRIDEEENAQSTALLSGVSHFELLFLDPNAAGAAASQLGGEWVERWPSGASQRALPLAVKISAELAGIGRVERIVGLPDAF